jgi:uncharacterized metal-binding protein
MNEKGAGSKGCPTLTPESTLSEANKEYASPDIKEFAYQASVQEAECYANRHQKPYIMQPTKTRIVEIIEFAEKMGYKRLGLAFCTGFVKEAAVVQDILKINGFEVASVVCKAGRTPKSEVGMKKEETVHLDTREAVCNPVYQAALLNQEGTEFNIVLGLCVGHDSLFFKYAEAPTTVLAVKDRVTGHNPLAAIYLSESYYQKVRHPEILEAEREASALQEPSAKGS